MWDHRNYYVLSEVYWQTGYVIFGSAWTGFENTYRPVSDLSELQDLRQAASRAFKQNLDKAKFLNSHYPDDASEAEFRQHQTDIKTAEEAASFARVERDQLTEVLRVPEANKANYERGANVRRRLVTAFSDSELTLLFGTGRQIDWSDWAKRPAFRVSFAQSLIYAPVELSNQRRATGFVEREKFDHWLGVNLKGEVQLSKREGPNQYVEMQAWFREFISTQPDNPAKNEVKELFKVEFPNSKKTTFDALWKICAPNIWQRAGRPKS